MVSYFGRFVPNLATLERLVAHICFLDLGLQVKTSIAACEGLFVIHTLPAIFFFFIWDRKTVIAPDACLYGLGAILYQVHDGELKPIAYPSRTLTKSERNCAQIEKECLGAVYACAKFERCLVGIPCVKVLTDHKPLIPILVKQALAYTPVRCQIMRMRLMRLNIVAEFMPWKDLIVADALSRSPGTHHSSRNEKELEADINMHADTVRMSWSVSVAK